LSADNYTAEAGNSKCPSCDSVIQNDIPQLEIQITFTPVADDVLLTTVITDFGRQTILRIVKSPIPLNLSNISLLIYSRHSLRRHFNSDC
jgi:hypothetical protein